MINKTHLPFLYSLLLIFTLFTTLLRPAVYAQETVDFQASLQAIEKRIETRRQELNIPGLSIAIVKDGETVFMKGFGYKDFERKKPVTPDTQFPIASTTKAFTALSLLMLEDEGKLSLDDNPKKYLPYFRINDAEIDKNITVRDLLSHSSGLPRTDMGWRTGRLSREELIRVAGLAKPTAGLREKFQYQNIMFTAAGEIVAEVEKKPWEKFVTERIFAPLGMNNSTMTIGEMRKAKDYSFGYEYNLDTKETLKQIFRDVPQVAPAGAINSSVRDMAKWLKFALSGETSNGRQIVSKESFSQWMKPQQKITPDGRISYALGWIVREWNGLKIVYHSGNTTGFDSIVAMIPEKNLGFVLLTNVTESPLRDELVPFIFRTLLSTEKNKTNTGSRTNSESSVDIKSAGEMIGRYKASVELKGADQRYKNPIEIKENDGKIYLVARGIPPLELRPKKKDVYGIVRLSGEYGIKAERDDNGKVTGITMIRPQGNLPFVMIGENEKNETQKSPADETTKNSLSSVNEIMAKTVEALGGEANWRKLRTQVTKYDVDYVNQGLKAYGTIYAKAPNLYADRMTLTALGKSIAEFEEYFDGTRGVEIASYSAQPEFHTGQRLEDIKLQYDFYGLLNWRKNLQSAEVQGIEKIEGEDAYKIVFRPEKATEYIYYISQKTFLPVKKTKYLVSNTSDRKEPISYLYDDYREVDGVMIPFETVRPDSSSGTVITRIKEIKNNVPIDDGKFKFEKN